MNHSTEHPSNASTGHFPRSTVLSASVVKSGNCRIDECCEIGAGVVLDGGSGGEGELVIERDACIHAGAVIAGNVTVAQGALVQAGAVIAGDLTVARGALVQAGAVVTRDVPPHAIVSGNPAQIVGYTNGNGDGMGVSHKPMPLESGASASSVRGVTLHRLTDVLDLRGNLTVGEFGRSIPFEAKRYFMVSGVPNAEVRGEHAHRTCHQFLICAHGRVSVVADDGMHREEFLLDAPSLGIHLPPLTWGVQYKYSPDAVLLVFASEFYDNHEYIRDYNEFLTLAADRNMP